MNERIKELARQAEKYADDNFRGEPTYSEAYDSKFAELIVGECMDNLAWHGHDEAVSQLEWFKVNKLGIK